MADLETDAQGPEIAREVVAGHAILVPRRSLTHEDCPALKAAFEEVTEAARARVVLDCKGVTLMDSEALELILAMHRSLESQGGVLKLVNLNDVCSDILTVTRLVNVFNVYANLNSAITGR